MTSPHHIDKINQTWRHGTTILHLLAERGFTRATHAALSISARLVNHGDKDGDTPLHLLLGSNLTFSEHRDTAPMLLGAGAGVNLVNKHGKTPVDAYKDNDCKKYGETRKEEKKKLQQLLKSFEEPKGEKDQTSFSRKKTEKLLKGFEEPKGVFQSTSDDFIGQSGYSKDQTSFSMEKTEKPIKVHEQTKQIRDEAIAVNIVQKLKEPTERKKSHSASFIRRLFPRRSMFQKKTAVLSEKVSGSSNKNKLKGFEEPKGVFQSTSDDFIGQSGYSKDQTSFSMEKTEKLLKGFDKSPVLSMKGSRHEFHSFLLKYDQQYQGSNFKWLRFLLNDELSIDVLSSSHVGMQLFKRLEDKGIISSYDVTILEEIADLTLAVSAAKDVVNTYKSDVGLNYIKPGKTVLTDYRKILFKALIEVDELTLKRLIDYYDAKYYDNIWDLVYYLEKNRFLKNTYESIKRFAINLNETAKEILMQDQYGLASDMDKTLLIQAIEERDWKKVKDLRSSKLECLVNNKEKNGWTPLLYALLEFDAPEDVAMFLIELSSVETLESQDPKGLGYTVLHVLCYRSYKTALALTLEKTNRHINKRDMIGQTPFHLCLSRSDSYNRHLEDARLLLKYGGSCIIEDNEGMTPIDYYDDNECKQYDETDRLKNKQDLKTLLEASILKNLVVDGNGGYLYDEDTTLYIPPGAIAEGKYVTISLKKYEDEQTYEDDSLWPVKDEPMAKDEHVARDEPMDFDDEEPMDYDEDKQKGYQQETRISPIVRCGPAGITFEKHVSLSFPCYLKGEESSTMLLYVKDYFFEKWRRVACDNTNISFAVKDGRCNLKTKHFTLFALLKKLVDRKKLLCVRFFGKILSEKYQFRVAIFEEIEKQNVLQEASVLGEKLLDFLHQIVVTSDNLEVKVELKEGWKVEKPTVTFEAREYWNLSRKVCVFLFLKNESGSFPSEATLTISQTSKSIPCLNVPINGLTDENQGQQLANFPNRDNIRFQQFLSTVSGIYEYTGTKWLKFLLKDQVPNCIISHPDIKGIGLFNALNVKNGLIKTIAILNEIAEVTEIYKAKKCIEEYCKINEHKPTNSTKILHEYRRALFEALREVGYMEIGTICGHYVMDRESYKDIWDVVDALESDLELQMREDSLKRFAKIINPRARRKITDVFNRPLDQHVMQAGASQTIVGEAS